MVKISPPVSSLFSRESAKEEQQHHQVSQKKQKKNKSRDWETKPREIDAHAQIKKEMSTPQFRAGNPLAPEKGAFPLDHFGECTSFKEKYLECLRVRRKFLSL
jgi:hypothetical protein